MAPPQLDFFGTSMTVVVEAIEALRKNAGQGTTSIEMLSKLSTIGLSLIEGQLDANKKQIEITEASMRLAISQAQFESIQAQVAAAEQGRAQRLAQEQLDETEPEAKVRIMRVVGETLDDGDTVQPEG